MAVKASATITLFDVVDVDGTTIYYLLQSSTANPPSKPTTDNPGGNWSTTEPTYTEGSTNTLYTVTKTKYSDGSFEYTPVSKSSSYEAAKLAYNKAVNAQNIANAAEPRLYHTCSSSGGTAGYFYFARCVVKGTYANKPITFSVSNRGIDQTNVELRFVNASGTDPDLLIFKKAGTANIYIIKTDVSTWDLYIKKTESYDSATFTKFSMNGYDNKFTWTWKDETVTELPDGCRAAGDESEIVVGTQTGATGAWTGVAGFDRLVDGQEISYWLPYAGSGNASLNLTLSDGSTTGAIPCYYSGANRITTHYAAGNVIHLTYRVNANVNGSKYTGWWADANYDSNTYDRVRFNNSIKAKTAIAASTLNVGDDSGYFKLIAGTIFDIDKPILWAISSIKVNETGSNNYISIPSCTIRNNTNSSWTATQYKTLYLVGILDGKKFTVDSTTPFTTNTPTSDDGKYYISLGYMCSTYQIYLYPEHPIYKYVNGEFKSLNQVAYEAQNSATEAYKIIISDEEPDSSKRDKIWYDTENNKFKEWNSTSSTWEIIHNYTSEINDAKALIEQAYDPTVKLANTLNQMMSALNNTVLGETIIVSETAPTSAADKLKIWLDVNNLSLNKWDYTMTYNLLTSKPSNWDTTYKNYYILVDGKYQSITDDTAPTWQANTYYSGTKTYSWMPVSPSSIMTTIDSHTVDIQKLKDKVVFDFETETDKVSFKDNWDTVFGKVKTLSQRFEFSALGLTITSSDSTTYKLRLTNEDIKILANDKEVTWWNATGFNCPVVTTESIVLRRKNFDANESRYSFRFVYNTNGSVSFRKVVES